MSFLGGHKLTEHKVIAKLCGKELTECPDGHSLWAEAESERPGGQHTHTGQRASGHPDELCGFLKVEGIWGLKPYGRHKQGYPRQSASHQHVSAHYLGFRGTRPLNSKVL